MKVLVTGGAGFIGSHLVEGLINAGHDVRVLDNFFSGREENLRSFRRDIEVQRGDCSDPRAARKAVKGIEVVYHEAAVPSVARSVDDPLRSHTANGTATLQMLVAAREAGVRRFMFAGSSSVYGNTRELPKHEGMKPSPLSPYAIEKLAGEHHVRAFAHLYGMETLTLRYFNVFGPRQDPSSPYSGVISLFTTALLTGRTPVFYGDGRQSRDFTYVANVVDANLRALEVPTLKGESVNVATNRAITLRELLAELAGLLGAPGRAEHRPVRAGDVRHSLADIRAARKLLGYRPSVDFETGLARTVEWYRQQTEAATARRKATRR
jgi:UDP-glucose 4-epimerase